MQAIFQEPRIRIVRVMDNILPPIPIELFPKSNYFMGVIRRPQSIVDLVKQSNFDRSISAASYNIQAVNYLKFTAKMRQMRFLSTKEKA
jgi:hypothetical protein